VRGKSYGWQEPAQYFRWVRDERGWMFQMECGSPSVPPLDSLRRFVPGLFDAPPGPLFPLTSAWAHHDACHYFKPYDAALRRLFGTPQSVEDYAAWGELLSADQHRAMFEAVNHRLWAITSGFTQWKINACWPSVEWQIYDWYLRPTASYYSIKRACEPLHVQLDLLDQTVSVINHRFGPEEGLQVSARVYDFKMKLRWEKGATTPVGGNTFHEVFTVQRPSDLSGVYFVKLEVKDRDGNRLSDNFYWLCAGDPTALTALEDLPLVELEASHEIQKHGEETVASVTVMNPTDHLALCVHLALTKGPLGEEILPVYWEDNYISLLPGESRKVRARFRTEDLAGAAPALEVGGWNILGPLECKDLKVSESRVKAGQALTVTTQIANTALGGSKIPLKVDGRSVAAKRFWARAGAGMARPLRFTLQLTAPGPHRISLGKMTSEVVVE
jgi:exo-1,4-beta-D-glucosaminidase